MKTNLLFKTQLLMVAILVSGTTLFAQVNHFQLGFGGALPAGWTGEGIFMTSTESNRNTTYEGTFGGTHAIKMLIPCVVTTKGYYTAGTLSFWIYEKNDGAGYVKVEKSTDGSTWMLIDSIAYSSTSPYTQHTYDINDNSPSVQLRFSSGMKEFYMDDVSLTSLPPADDNAYLLNLGVNGTYFPEFETVVTDYAADITYPTATIDAITFNPEATFVVDYPQPEDYFGTEAERTGTVTVTAKDGAATETYNILFNVTGYHVQFGFPSTGGNKAVDGWEAVGTYIASSENNGLYEGDNALRFTKDSGYVHSTRYFGVDTISFYTKVGTNDGSAVTPGETLSVKAKGKSDIFWTDLGTLVTGTDITESWQKVEYILDMNSETDSIEIEWMVEYENSQTRIYIEDIGISGHPTYMDPSFYSDVENSMAQHVLLKVYPNPASEFIMAELPGNRSNGVLRIYNMTGQEVITSIIDKNISTIEVSGLSEGIYIISAEAEGVSYKNKLMIK